LLSLLALSSHGQSRRVRRLHSLEFAPENLRAVVKAHLFASRKARGGHTSGLFVFGIYVHGRHICDEALPARERAALDCRCLRSGDRRAGTAAVAPTANGSSIDPGASAGWPYAIRVQRFPVSFQ
jgi:hypothetical protein